MSRAIAPAAAAIRLLPEIVAVQLRYNLIQRVARKPLLPRAMHFIANHSCNARCIMCGIWREGSVSEQLSPSEIASLARDRLFSRLQYIGISGGEPFLRHDLPELVEVFQQACSGLKRISITTNGLLPRRMAAVLDRLTTSCRRTSTLLDISVSCHALGAAADKIFGVRDAFDHLQESLSLLKRYRDSEVLTFSLNAVLLKENLAEADKLLRWAASQGVGISFVSGERRARFHNDDLADSLVAEGDKDQLAGFIRSLALKRELGLHRFKYKAMLEVLEGRPRRVSCYYAFAGFLLGFDGTLYYCSHSRALGNCRKRTPYEIFYDAENLQYRRDLLRVSCQHCPPYTTTRLEQEKDLVKLARFLLDSR